MVAARYGKSDPDVNHKGSKEKTDKPMLKASAKTPYTGKIGGPSNVPANAPAREFARGGSVVRKR